MGGITAYFIYFAEVFLLMARANDEGMKLTISIAEFVLQNRYSKFESVSSDELGLLISCINLARPQISIFGINVKFKAAIVICGAVLATIIPKFFIT